MKSKTHNDLLPISEHNWDESAIPIVSVFCWVYNDKNYIRQCIDSILMQKTAFPVEIIIHDDASNDGTTAILLEYELKYPILFRNILQKVNQWSQGNSVMTPLFEKPRGHYIALSHGDDYWTDPFKLQKQVEFLDEHEHVNLVASKYNSEEGAFKHTDGLDDWKKIELNKLIWHNFIPTSSVCFRRFTCNARDANFMSKMQYGDFALYMILCNTGDFWINDYPQSYYRKHITGAFSSKSSEENCIGMTKAAIETLNYLTLKELKREMLLVVIYRINELIEVYRIKPDFIMQNKMRLKRFYYQYIWRP
jgi:glycosyltransferase involved in cell wall biosynthesis